MGLKLEIKKISSHYYIKIDSQEFIFDNIEQMKEQVSKLIDEHIKTGNLFKDIHEVPNQYPPGWIHQYWILPCSE